MTRNGIVKYEGGIWAAAQVRFWSIALGWRADADFLGGLAWRRLATGGRQPSTEEFRRFAQLGAKSVLVGGVAGARRFPAGCTNARAHSFVRLFVSPQNVRDASEAGKVGLGVLLTEPQLCRDLNLDYFAGEQRSRLFCVAVHWRA